MRARPLCLSGLCLVGATVAGIACGSSPAGTTGTLPSGNTSSSSSGQLAVTLVDAASRDVDQIWVNITKVTAHSTTDGWITVASFSPPTPVDLLALKASADELGLGTVNVQSGQITQIRLYVTQDGNWVHVMGDPSTTQTPLKVPSGSQSGIKIIGPWNVVACSRTSVTLDFDGQHSIQVHPTGQDTEWILRPVIRVKKVDTTPINCQEGGAGGAGTLVPTGGSCTSNQDCLTDNCTELKCAPGVPGAPCQGPTDCTRNVCQNGTCQPPLPG